MSLCKPFQHGRQFATTITATNDLGFREIFSVAPMMGHTHRHYRRFFRKLSQHAFLYTEMIPAAQIMTAFQRAMQETGKNSGIAASNGLDIDIDMDWETIPEVLSQAQSSSSPILLSSGLGMLDAMLRLSSDQEHPVVLQLGGRDPKSLALAAAIGSSYGYDEINLNCGCPSNAVSGGDRSGGAALMRHPELVARCVQAMTQAVVEMATVLDQPVPCRITVKHRLGVADASSYLADKDRSNPRGEDEAFDNCQEFVRLITLAGDASKIQVHARLGLLGSFEPENGSSSPTGLWVPGGSSLSGSDQKIDHKRVQYRAKQRARQATIQNRNVPPLRPLVVDRIAAEFPSLQVVSNGGIRTMEDIQERLSSSENSISSSVMGAMVGRAVINHPCSFGNVDALWTNGDNISASTLSREAVLLDYIEYCKQEEKRFLMTTEGDSTNANMASLRRRLVAVPFNLFAGELGNEAYQRRIRKLISRAERHTSPGILGAALTEVPLESSSKPVNQFSTDIDDLPVFEASYQRSGPLQRMIF